jgi:hypothetical protein
MYRPLNGSEEGAHPRRRPRPHPSSVLAAGGDRVTDHEPGEDVARVVHARVADGAR